MAEDITQQLMERHGQGPAPYQFPESVQGLMGPVMENPPDENEMRNAMSFYMNRMQFPELQTALEAGGVIGQGAGAQNIPAALQAFMQAEDGMDPMEKERQARIFLSMMQGGGAPPLPVR